MGQALKVSAGPRKKAPLPAFWDGPLGRGSREGALIVLSAVALYLAISMASYAPSDPGWSHSGDVERVVNKGGVVGAWLADVLLYLFGYLAYLFPLGIAYFGWLAYRGPREALDGVDLYGVLARCHFGFHLH